MESTAFARGLILNVEHPDWARAVASADQFLIATGRGDIGSLLSKTWDEAGADGLGRTAIAMVLELWKTCPAEYRVAGSPSFELLSRKFREHTAFSLTTTTVLDRGGNFVTSEEISAAEEVLGLLDSASLVLKDMWRAMGGADAIHVASATVGRFERRPAPGLFLALIALCVASAKVIREHDAE